MVVMSLQVSNARSGFQDKLPDALKRHLSLRCKAAPSWNSLLISEQNEFKFKNSNFHSSSGRVSLLVTKH